MKKAFLLIHLFFVLIGGAKTPNIVLILSDDQSYTDYGFMGHPHIETPHLDKLASESALFRRGYVPTALCRPALATCYCTLFPSKQDYGNNPADTPENLAHAKRTARTRRN